MTDMQYMNDSGSKNSHNIDWCCLISKLKATHTPIWCMPCTV